MTSLAQNYFNTFFFFFFFFFLPIIELLSFAHANYGPCSMALDSRFLPWIQNLWSQYLLVLLIVLLCRLSWVTLLLSFACNKLRKAENLPYQFFALIFRWNKLEFSIYVSTRYNWSNVYTTLKWILLCKLFYAYQQKMACLTCA